MRPFALIAAGLSVALAPAVAAQTRAIEFPDVPGAHTLVVDLHTHSVFSDGKVWPSIRVDEARRDGLDLLAVTEHLEYQNHHDDIPHPDRNRSYDVAHEHAGDGESAVIVINGAEITKGMPPGHVNAVFLSDANALRHEDPELSRAENAELAYAAAAAQGAFVFWNHPSWTGQRKDGVARMEDIHRSLIERGLLHGVEVANEFIYSADALQMALDHDLAILGTSDVHGLIDWDYDVHAEGHRTVTLVFAKERSAAAAREALHARRTVAWMRNTLIGREELLRPLVEASLTVERAKRRGEDAFVEVTLRNHSDATFELANRGGHNFYGQAALIRVPAHGKIDLGLAGESRDHFALQFEVLNAVTAPEQHLALQLEVDLR